MCTEYILYCIKCGEPTGQTIRVECTAGCGVYHQSPFPGDLCIICITINNSILRYGCSSS